MMEKTGKVRYSDDSPEFFKVYLDQLCSKQLRIPPYFVEKFNGDMPQTLTLEGSGRRSWQIIVGKHDRYFFLQEGWQKFVQDNSLENGDFLTFCCVGCSIFYVKIFGKHGCRKDVAFTSGDDSQMDRKNKNDNAMEQLHGMSNSTTRITRRSLRSRTRGSGSKISQAGKVQEKLRYKSDPFTVLLTKTYLAKCVNFPPNFGNVEKHWLSGKNAILRVRQKQWEVSIAKCGKKYQLSKGWSSFVKDNSLKKGDKCTFRLIDNNDDGIVLKVTNSKFRARIN